VVTRSKKTKKVNKGRRKVVKWLPSIPVLLWACVKATRDGLIYDFLKDIWGEGERFLVHKGIRRDLETDGADVGASRNWELINSIFGPFRQVVVSPASDHPDLHGHRHNSDWRGALPFAAALRASLGEPQVLTSEHMDVIRGNFRDWDKVLVGGAVSHPLARIAQGYAGTGYSLRWTRKIPQRWVLCFDCDALSSREPVMVYHSNSTELRPEPAWEIKDTVTGTVYAPKVGHNRSGRRILKSDWLLLTKVWEHEEYKPLVLTAGCHNVGTASLRHILGSRLLLSDLASGVKTFPQWQAMYRVVGVEYDDDGHRCVTTPDQLSLEQVCELRVDPVEVDWPRPPGGLLCPG
jgi:hypothetical protein